MMKEVNGRGSPWERPPLPKRPFRTAADHHPRQITTSTDQRKAQRQAASKCNRMNRAKEGPKPARVLLWQGGRSRL